MTVNLYAKVININEKTDTLSILENSYLYIDKDSTKTISQISNKEGMFTSISENFMNYGYKFKETFWIKFSVHNSSSRDIIKYLVFDSPNIDILNLYFYKNDKEYIIQNGIFTRKTFQSELSFRFPLSLDINESRTYYLEIKPITHSLHFTLKIKDYATFKNDELHHQLLLTIFFSTLFVVMVYNAIIFMVSKDTIYIYYSIFILTLLVHHLHIRGMLAYFLPENSHIFTTFAYMPVYNLAVVPIAISLFVNKFLNLQKYPKLYFILKLFILAMLTITVLHSSTNYILNYLTPLVLLFALYMEFIGLYLFITTKEKNAKYFFIIWSITLGGMIGTILYYIGLLTAPIPYLFEITVLVEVFLFSIVLASQIKDLQNEKLQNNKIIIEQSKLSSMGEMLQNIAHQWRQPLSEINAVAMKIDADFYTQRLDASSLESDITRIENITYHMSNTIESFISYFKETKHLDETTLSDVINKVLNIMGNSLKDVKVDIVMEDNPTLSINTSEFMQVLLVIINNAIDALNVNNIEDKIIIIRVIKLDKKLSLEIQDNAGGIKEENIDKIFEPYFTTKFQADGIGVGLYMAKMLIEESLEGSLSVENTQDGAKFTITL